MRSLQEAIEENTKAILLQTQAIQALTDAMLEGDEEGEPELTHYMDGELI